MKNFNSYLISFKDYFLKISDLFSNYTNIIGVKTIQRFTGDISSFTPERLRVIVNRNLSNLMETKGTEERTEYWFYFIHLFIMAMTSVIALAVFFAITSIPIYVVTFLFTNAVINFWFFLLYSISLIIVILFCILIFTATMRRLTDTGVNKYLVFIAFIIPFGIGSIIVGYLCSRPKKTR